MTIATTTFPSSLDLTTLTTNTNFNELGEAQQENLGTDITFVPDLDNDGKDEVMTSAPDISTVYVRFGGPGDNVLTIMSVPNDQLGYKLCVGRLNDDNLYDLIMVSKSAIFVVFGSPTLRSLGSLSLSSYLDGIKGYKINLISGYAGKYAVTSGNLGNAQDTLIVGAPDISTTFAMKSNITSSVVNFANATAFNLTGVAHDNSGAALGFAGDTLVIGAYGDSGNRGAVWLLSQQAIYNLTVLQNLNTLSLQNLLNTTGICKVLGKLTNDQFGYFVSGFIKNDGNRSIMVGAIGVSNFGGAGIQIDIGPDFCPSGIFPSSLIDGNNGCVMKNPKQNAYGGTVAVYIGKFSGTDQGAFYIGSPGEDAGYLVFPKPGYCSTGTFLLSGPNLDGSNGVKLIGPAGSATGSSASPIEGDFNGDNNPDLTTGSPGPLNADPGRYDIVYGAKIASLLNNFLNVTKGGTVDITINNFDATFFTRLDLNSKIVLSTGASTIGHGNLIIKGSFTPVSFFTVGQVQNNTLQFVHDNSPYAPYCFIQVLGDSTLLSMPLQPCNINFIYRGLVVGNNQMDVTDGQTIPITPNQLSVVNLDNSQDTSGLFLVSNVQHGAYKNAGVAVNSFRSTDNIQFTHDGSGIAPSCKVAVTDGTLTSPAQDCVFNFSPAPKLILGAPIEIGQGQSVFVTVNNFNATGGDDASLQFIFTNAAHLHFESTLNEGVIIESCSLADLKAIPLRIKAVADNSGITPSFNVAVYNGKVYTSTQIPVVNFALIPVIENNAFSVNENEVITLTTAQLSATQGGYPLRSLLFEVSNQVGGYYTFNTTKTIISNFTLGNVEDGIVQYVSTGGVPSNTITVRAGSLKSAPQNTNPIYNALPVWINRSLRVSQDQPIIITSNDLSASDRETPDDELQFIADILALMYGDFEFTAQPYKSIDKFTQGNVRRGEVLYRPNGSLTPILNMSLSDGSEGPGVPSLPFEPVVVNFTPTSATAASSSSAGLNTAIGVGISVGTSLLLYLIKYSITHKIQNNLITKLNLRAANNATTAEEIEKKNIYIKIISPIVNEVMSAIKTSNLVGYRSEKSTDDYISAIQAVVFEVAKRCGIKLSQLADKGEVVVLSEDKQIQQFVQREAFIQEVVSRTKKQILLNRSRCSAAYLRSFCQPDITPDGLRDKSVSIAENVFYGLKNADKSGASVAPHRNQVVDNAGIELSPIISVEEVKSEEKTPQINPITQINNVEQRMMGVVAGLQKTVKDLEDKVTNLTSLFWNAKPQSPPPVPLKTPVNYNQFNARI